MGGTGKFEGATGYLYYLAMADFYQNTLILGYLLRALAEKWARLGAARPGTNDLAISP